MQGRKLKSEAWTSLDSTIENSKKKIWFYSKNKFIFIANLLIKQDRKPTFGVLTTYESTRQIQEEENIANHQPDQMLISQVTQLVSRILLQFIRMSTMQTDDWVITKATRAAGLIS